MHTLALQSLLMPEIDRHSHTPAWKQIAADLRAKIADGTYPPDGLLPSITTLTREWSVARLTANKALRQMVAEGLAGLEPGMGFYVMPPHGAPVAHGNTKALPPEREKGF